MKFDTPASMWMLSPPRWMAVTLSFDLKNSNNSSVGASGYSLSSRLLK